jgi:hypothetical protein
VGVLKRVALVAPFLLGPLLLRPSVRPLADALADVVSAVAPVAAAAPASDDGAVASEPAGEPPLEHGGRGRYLRSARVPRVAPSSSAADAGIAVSTGDAGSPTAPPQALRGTIVVPASIVAEAIARKDVGATNARGPDGRPLGARIHGVGRYHTGLRDGDVIVTVAGMPTPTTAALVDCAMRALGDPQGQAARTLSGTILRGGGAGGWVDETWTVVLELPPTP